MRVNTKKVKNYLLKKEKNNRIVKERERTEIISKLESVKFLWEKYGVERVYLYGSFADITFHEYSDIDVAIEPEISFENWLHLYSEINNHIQREIDIRLLNELPFAREIKRDGIVLYERKNSNPEKRNKK